MLSFGTGGAPVGVLWHVYCPLPQLPLNMGQKVYSDPPLRLLTSEKEQGSFFSVLHGGGIRLSGGPAILMLLKDDSNDRMFVQFLSIGISIQLLLLLLIASLTTMLSLYSFSTSSL